MRRLIAPATTLPPRITTNSSNLVNVEGKLHLRVDAALDDELAGLPEDQARQVARSTMPVGSVMTVAGWLLWAAPTVVRVAGLGR